MAWDGLKTYLHGCTQTADGSSSSEAKQTQQCLSLSAFSRYAWLSCSMEARSPASSTGSSSSAITASEAKSSALDVAADAPLLASGIVSISSSVESSAPTTPAESQCSPMLATAAAKASSSLGASSDGVGDHSAPGSSSAVPDSFPSLGSDISTTLDLRCTPRRSGEGGDFPSRPRRAPCR